MVALDVAEDGTDPSMGVWGRLYAVVPLVASAAGVGLALVDPTRLSLGPARYVGLPGVAVGVLLVGWTASTAGETLSPVGQPDRLVTSGPFAWTRNPMYLGVVTAVAGVAVLAGSPVCGSYAGLMAIVYHALVVAVEEPKLAAAFGDPYRDYCSRVPRWLPRRE